MDNAEVRVSLAILNNLIMHGRLVVFDRDNKIVFSGADIEPAVMNGPSVIQLTFKNTKLCGLCDQPLFHGTQPHLDCADREQAQADRSD